jgi:hypothetical protein
VYYAWIALFLSAIGLKGEILLKSHLLGIAIIMNSLSIGILRLNFYELFQQACNKGSESYNIMTNRFECTNKLRKRTTKFFIVKTEHLKIRQQIHCYKMLKY